MFIEKLADRLERLNRMPGYMPAQTVTGMNQNGEREWWQTERVCGRGHHIPKKGKVDSIREMPEAYAAELEAIDAERKRLKAALAELDRQERETLKAAWPVSRPVTVAEVKAAKAAREQQASKPE